MFRKMERMESFLKRNFKVVHKNPSEDAQPQWQIAIGAVVKNCRRCFRMVPDLDKRSVVEAKKLKIQQFKPGYTAPPKLFLYRTMPMHFRQCMSQLVDLSTNGAKMIKTVLQEQSRINITTNLNMMKLEVNGANSSTRM